jgi:hypothetical protein
MGEVWLLNENYPMPLGYFGTFRMHVVLAEAPHYDKRVIDCVKDVCNYM